MTISTTYAPVQYNGNGVTTLFAFPYSFFDNSDLMVTLTVVATGVDTPQTIITDYTVTGGGGDDGSITFLTAPPSGTRVTIELDLPYTQEDDYVENQAFPAETLEAGFDKAAIRDQQLLSAASRSLKFPATLSGSLVGQLPAPEDGKLLAWSGTGGDVISVSLGSVGENFDTLFSGLASGDFLRYNGSVWINSQLSGTIAVNGTASAGAGISLAEDTDNGTNKVTLKAPDTLAADYTLTLPTSDGSAGNVLQTNGSGQLSFVSSLSALKGYISGLVVNNDVTDAVNDISISAGRAISDDGTINMVGSAMIKRLDAAWAAGTNQGMRDTGSISDATWHIFIISTADGSTVDYLASLSISSPTMPATYTKKRRIGSIRRVSGSIVLVDAVETSGGGVLVTLKAPKLDLNSSAITTSNTTVTVTAGPIGFKYKGHFMVAGSNASTNVFFGIFPTFVTAANPAILTAPFATYRTQVAGANIVGRDSVVVDASGQLYARADTASTTMFVGLISYEDGRR